MTPEDYIQSRLDDQINWYSRRSQSNQWWFKGLRIVEIVLASTIPFLVGQITTDTPWLRIIVGGMGVCIAVVSGLVSLYKFHENWIEYRTTAETLKHEKFLFLTKAPPYDSETAFHVLVERVESLISKENTNWSRSLREKPKEKHPG